MIKFTHERRAHAPSHPAIAIKCRLCGQTTTRHILMRRVYRHIEQMKSAVRVSIRCKCGSCGSDLVTRVRVTPDRKVHYATIKTELASLRGKR